MASLGFQGIYRYLNSRADIICERAFFPGDSVFEEYVRSGTPIFSLESKRPLAEFDIIAFSVAFENDYPNIARILRQSRIPLLSAERTVRHPVVMGGGVCATINPEPFAPFFDLLFVGDAEESLPAFLNIYAAEGKAAVGAASGIPGIYIPANYEVRYGVEHSLSSRAAKAGAPTRISRQVCEFSDDSPIRTAVVSAESEFSDMYLVEAMRGCPWGCRFCMVGNLYRPVRHKSVDAVASEIAEARRLGCRVGLVGPSLTDYRFIDDVLAVAGVEFSLTSLRADERSAHLLKRLAGARSISIAPEAGTERLRKVINKRITERGIIETARLVLEHGVRNLRLYFMIGLPSEQDDDIDGLVALVRAIRSQSPRGMVTAGVGTFVPKPFTPFQWCAMDTMQSVKEKLRRIKSAFRAVPNVRVVHDVPKYAYLQGFFARGDRRLADVLRGMADGLDHIAASEKADIDTPWFLFREREHDEVLPWDFIDAGVPKEWLWNEYRHALLAE